MNANDVVVIPVDWRNPKDTKQTSGIMAKKIKKVPDSLHSGPGYQVKLMFLALYRALRLKYNFELTTEWAEAEKFDDVVFLLKDEANVRKSGLFLQAKHKMKNNIKISYNDLLKEGKADFSLKKYFISYMNMRENPKLDNVKINFLMIFTNIDFDQKTVKSKNILSRIKKNDTMYRFKFGTKVPTLYHLIPDDTIKSILGTCSQGMQLAEELVDHVFSNTPKQLTLETPIFKKFHMALCKHVIDKVSKKFQENFAKGENLLARVQNFRSIFYECIARRINLANKDNDANNLVQVVQSVENIILRADFLTENEASSNELPNDSISEEDIQDFFERLVFAVDQPNAVELGQWIKHKVRSSLKLSQSKDIVEQVLRDLTDWSTHRKGEFITAETGKSIFDNAKNMMNNRFGIGLGATYKAKLKTYSINIQFNDLHSINDFLNDDKSYVVKSNEPLLTMIKIYKCITEHDKYKTIDSHIFIELSNLLENEQQNSVFSALHSNQLFIIHCDGTDKEFYKLLEMLNDKMKTLLVVVQSEIPMQTNITDEFSVKSDTTNFNDLNSNSQTLLLKKLVNFQGNLIKLGALIETRSEWNEILDGECIAELITNEQVEIGSAPLKLSQLEAAYARRYKQIEPQHILNALKLESQVVETEIFLFTENTKQSSANLIESSSHIDYTNCKKINFVLNEKEEINIEIFKKICYYNSEKSVYWLEIVNDNFHWLQVYDPHFYIKRNFVPQKLLETTENLDFSWSENKGVVQIKKTTSEIGKFGGPLISRRRRMKYKSQERTVAFCSMQSEAKKTPKLLTTANTPFASSLKTKDEKSENPLINEEKLANADDRVVVLVAEPGMGKTTTLTQLSGYKLRDSWVIRLNLRNHQDHIKNLPEDYIEPDRATKSIIAFLLKVTQTEANQTLSVKLLKYSLSHQMKRSLLIMFDGYDEISDECRKKLISLMKHLKEKTLAKLWISSRKEHTRHLEQTLGVLSTTFKELVSNEREVYLKNFYQVRLKLQLNESKTELVFREVSGLFDVFFKALLAKVDKVFKYNLSRFMGIPLQLRLIAEGFLPEFEEYIDNSTHINQPEFEDLDVLHFYQRFINVKYDIYFQEKTRLAIGMSAESKKWLTDDLNEMHQRVALKLLFPEKYKSVIRDVEMSSEQEKELLRVGILHADPFEERSEFTHRTFAEYFIAQFLLESFRQLQHPHKFQAVRALLMQIIRLPSNEVICIFLNEQITDADLSLVKFGGNFDTAEISKLEDISKDYVKLTEFILSFLKNKIWILKQLDFSSFLRERLFNQSDDFVKQLLGLMSNHYDVVHACLVHNPFILSKQFLLAAEFRDRKSKVKIIMSAIKCYPKIIEEITRDYYVEYLCDLFADNLELCQLISKLKADDIKMTPYEVAANEVLEEFVGDDSEYNSDSEKEVQSVYYFEHNVVGKTPYKITRGKQLQNLVAGIDETVCDVDEDSKLAPSFLLPYEWLNQKLKSIKIEPPKRCRPKLKREINVIEILSCAIKLARNQKYNMAKDSLNSLTHLPIASLWFNTQYNSLFQELLTEVMKNKQKTLVLFLFNWLSAEPIISVHLFSIVFLEHPQYTQKLIHSVECEEMIAVLSELLSTVKSSLRDNEIKKFASNLLKANKSKNHKKMRKALNCVEGSNSENIMNWITRQLTEHETEFESEIVLKTVLEFLAEHGEWAMFKVINKDDFSLLQQMMNCMKNFPRLLHSLMLTYISHHLEFFYTYRSKHLFFIFDFVQKELPKTSACFLANLLDGNLCSPLSYALKYNHTDLLKLIFDILLPYPTILTNLILTPSLEHKTHLHLAIIESDKSTLEMFLSQLNRDNEVREYVLKHFVTDEEDKYQLYKKIEFYSIDSLLTFLNHFKVAHFQLFKTFFLPADKSAKPAFYLAGERGLKKVMDVLLRVLKSEGETLWELLTWTEPATGKTVLHQAAERGYREIVDAILSSHRKQKNELKTLFFVTDKLGHTLLDGAVLSKRQIIRNNFNIEGRNLIEREDYITFRNNFGDEKCVECLRTLSVSLIKMPMVVNLILVLAKSFNSVKLMMAMFENAELRLVLEGMNVTKDDYSYHLFYSAIERNSFELVNELINKDYDVNCTNGYGYTPVMKAVIRYAAGNTKNTRITKLLMQSGADIYM